MTVIFLQSAFRAAVVLDDRRLMLPGIDAITDDGGLAQRLGGLKPVQALDQYEARAVLAHQDRRLLANSEHAVCDRIDALQVERFTPRCRHVDIGDREGLAFQHVQEGSTVARSVRAHTCSTTVKAMMSLLPLSPERTLADRSMNWYDVLSLASEQVMRRRPVQSHLSAAR